MSVYKPKDFVTFSVNRLGMCERNILFERAWNNDHLVLSICLN